MNLQVVTINVTERCPNRCLGCYIPLTGEEMSMKDFVTIIDKLQPAKTIKAITLSGGEPFLHRELPRMCRYVSDIIRKPNIFTSGVGSLVKDSVDLEKFYEYVGALNISIKYPKQEDNDRWFVKEGIFKSTLDTISRARDLGVRVNIHFCVDRGNLVYFDDMYDLALELDCGLDVLRYLPFGRSGKELQIAMNDVEWITFCNTIKDLPNIRLIYAIDDKEEICLAGLTRINIFPDGSVTPCIYINDRELRKRWNILDQYLVEIMCDMYGWRNRYGEKSGCIAKRGLGVD